MEHFAFRKLDVYVLSKELVKNVYCLMKKFPLEERYALCDQLRRSAVSILSNIAEGMGRYSNKEQAHFLEISYGSLCEVYGQLDVANDLGYISSEEFENLSEKIERVAKMLSGLRAKRLSFEPAAPLSPISGIKIE